MQDLRIINEAVQHPAPIVPNITAMSQVPANSCWFTLIDLANAYLSISVQSDSQLFACTFNGKRYTSCPTLFAVAENLTHWQPMCGSTLVQYFDDLLICSVHKKIVKLTQYLCFVSWQKIVIRYQKTRCSLLHISALSNNT